MCGRTQGVWHGVSVPNSMSPPSVFCSISALSPNHFRSRERITTPLPVVTGRMCGAGVGEGGRTNEYGKGCVCVRCVGGNCQELALVGWEGVAHLQRHARL